MATIETGNIIPRFAFWNPSTWAIPELYWDTFSQEQRIHAICKQLGKVIAYADYLGVNVDDIASRLKAIEDGQLDDLIIAEIEAWFEENEPAIMNALAALNEALPIDEFDAENTVKDAIDVVGTEVEAIENALPISDFSSESTVKDALDAKLNTSEFAQAFPNTAEKLLECVECYYDTALNVYVKTFKIPRSYTMNVLPYTTFSATPAYDYVTEHEPVFLTVGPLGSQIVSNGVVVGNTDDSESYHWYVLGIDASGNIDMVKDVFETLTGNDLLSMGYVTAFRIWSPVIQAGYKFNWNAQIDDDGTTNKAYIFEGFHSRSMIGWDTDYFYFIYVDAQIPNSTGVDFEGMYSIADRYDLDNVANMDGGGSVQAWTSKPTYNHIFQNKRVGKVPYTRTVPLIEFVKGA